jgi:prepilin-type N-terminal cleavage/methylation domain-containing protein
MNKSSQSGFTLIDMLMVISISSVLAISMYGYVNRGREKAYYGRALYEYKVMERALEVYRIDNETLPPDVVRNIPPGIESYLGSSDDDNWPNGPWPGSVYDYDAFVEGGVPTYQISIRFCAVGQPSTCRFPREVWAEDFNINSSVYFCLEGNCKAHPSQPATQPGYCVNCAVQPYQP